MTDIDHTFFDSEVEELDVSIEELADEINKAHRDFRMHRKMTFRSALTAGDKLLEAKKIIGKGGFEDYMRNDCDISPQQGRKYMNCARNRAQIEAHLDSGEVLTIDAAAALTAPDDEESSPVSLVASETGETPDKDPTPEPDPETEPEPDPEPEAEEEPEVEPEPDHKYPVVAEVYNRPQQITLTTNKLDDMSDEDRAAALEQLAAGYKLDKKSTAKYHKEQAEKEALAAKVTPEMDRLFAELQEGIDAFGAAIDAAYATLSKMDGSKGLEEYLLAKNPKDLSGLHHTVQMHHTHVLAIKQPMFDAVRAINRKDNK